MASIDENILKAAKEIVIKFIECGRLSPSGFSEAFQSIYRTVEETVKTSVPPTAKAPAPPSEAKPPTAGPKPPGGRR